MTYDASRRRLDEIERILKAHGDTLSHDWWTQHVKRNWYHFTEDNLRARATHISHPVTKSPE